MTKTRSLSIIFLIFSLFSLASCSGIVKGVTKAVMEEDKVDRRLCEIEGPEFNGIKQSLEDQAENSAKVTKILMVHGISTHLPGYSSRFQRKLYETLALDKTDAQTKTIKLDSNKIAWEGDDHVLGELNITRHMDASGQNELIFYELTWSPITTPQKLDLAADSANNEGLLRADLNGSLKSFMNETVPDMLIYNGAGYQKITKAVEESVCWMMADSWSDLPESGAHVCSDWAGSDFSDILTDDHFFVTHSLGSRITIDTVHNFAFSKISNNKNISLSEIENKVRDKEFTVFMMANQLPLLQMGRAAPEVTGYQDEYCKAGGKYTNLRLMKKMNIIAFSDPNDILSYPVPMSFTRKYIDSRTCPSVTNISLNVAHEKDVLGAFTFANPVQAHNGYIEDDRVISLIAEGIHEGRKSTLIQDSCRWIELKNIANAK